MPCLLAHKWVMGEVFDVKRFSPWRKCERCGIVQRGTYDNDRKDITWETMRERAYQKSKHGQIVRHPTSELDRLAHFLGLRRTRMTDKTISTKRSVQKKP